MKFNGGIKILIAMSNTLLIVTDIHSTLKEILQSFYSLREKVFTIKKIIFKSKNRVFTGWDFKLKK